MFQFDENHVDTENNVLYKNRYYGYKLPPTNSSIDIQY